VSDATEGGASGALQVSRDDTTGDLLVGLSASGTATPGSDYYQTYQVFFPDGTATATITVIPIDDSDVEGTETVTYTLLGGTGYTVGSPDVLV
jgi:hypothetical protein